MFENTPGSRIIFHYEMDDAPPFMLNQTKALDIHAGGAKDLTDQRKDVRRSALFYAKIFHK